MEELKCLFEEAGDVHLRDTDLGGDLALGEFVGEPEGEDALHAGRKGRDQGPQREDVVDPRVGGIGSAQAAGEIDAVMICAGVGLSNEVSW